MLIIPSIKLAGGRLRVVNWPGAAAGIGAPSDRSEVIAERLVRDIDVEVAIAGGVIDLTGIRHLRDSGLTGIILGEALLSGRIEYPAAMETAA